jgi:hypothetical protein
VESGSGRQVAINQRALYRKQEGIHHHEPHWRETHWQQGSCEGRLPPTTTDMNGTELVHLACTTGQPDPTWPPAKGSHSSATILRSPATSWRPCRRSRSHRCCRRGRRWAFAARGPSADSCPADAPPACCKGSTRSACRPARRCPAGAPRATWRRSPQNAPVDRHSDRQVARRPAPRCPVHDMAPKSTMCS